MPGLQCYAATLCDCVSLPLPCTPVEACSHVVAEGAVALSIGPNSRKTQRVFGLVCGVGSASLTSV